jgi:hypothetical protein
MQTGNSQSQVSSEAAELVRSLVLQFAYDIGDGVYESGCLSTLAEAMRWLAKQDLAEIIQDGPGRHVRITVRG